MPEVTGRPQQLRQVPRMRPFDPRKRQQSLLAQVRDGQFHVLPGSVLRQDRPDNHFKRCLARPPMLRTKCCEEGIEVFIQRRLRLRAAFMRPKALSTVEPVPIRAQSRTLSPAQSAVQGQNATFRGDLPWKSDNTGPNSASQAECCAVATLLWLFVLPSSRAILTLKRPVPSCGTGHCSTSRMAHRAGLRAVRAAYPFAL